MAVAEVPATLTAAPPPPPNCSAPDISIWYPLHICLKSCLEFTRRALRLGGRSVAWSSGSPAPHTVPHSNATAPALQRSSAPASSTQPTTNTWRGTASTYTRGRGPDRNRPPCLQQQHRHQGNTHRCRHGCQHMHRWCWLGTSAKENALHAQDPKCCHVDYSVGRRRGESH